MTKKLPPTKKEREIREEPFTEDDYMDALTKASKPVRKTTIPNQLDDEDAEDDKSK